MTPKKTLAGLGATVILMGGIDASVLAETPLERVETIANERVEAKQIGNVVETTLPWKGELGLKVKYDMGEPTVAEKFKDKRNKEVITETVDFGDGGFKVDILLNEKPSTNVFCYQIEGAENYDFFYQPPLTAEEIAEGAERPENIQGSYAVYHKTLKNHREGAENYATGKVMHIPRPQVWELNNQASTTEWADLSYSEQDGLCVTARQEFLDNATYPVRVDPTFGYTTEGGSSLNAASNSCAGRVAAVEGQYTASTGDVVTGISIYSIASSSRPFNVEIYSLTATGTPDTRLGNGSSTIDTGTSVAWYSTTTLSLSLSNGSVYSPAFSIPSSPAGGVSIYYDEGTAPGRLSTTNSGCSISPVMTNPFGPVGTDSGRSYSIYATYTASASSSTSTDSGAIWFE